MEAARAVNSTLPFPSYRRPAQVGDQAGFLHGHAGGDGQNNRVSVSHHLQGGQSRAELATVVEKCGEIQESSGKDCLCCLQP